MKCIGCGLDNDRRLCNFCRRTVELIQARQCVACKEPVFDGDTERVEGRCAECRSQNVSLSVATRKLLHLAAVARYNATKAA